MSVEQQLRDTFESYADRAATPVDVHALVLDRHHRAQRRRLFGTALTVSAVLVVGVPATMLVLDAPPAQVDVSQPGADFVPGPTRGSLADDTAFLADLVQLPWGRGLDAVQPPTSDRHVLFAGDVPGARWAWVVARVGGAWSGVWFAGPAGASAEALEIDGEANPDGIGAQVVTKTSPTQQEGPLLVLAEPGDVVEISDAPEIAADGTVTRTYRPVETVDGVAVVSRPGSAYAALGVQVVRDGEPVYRLASGIGPDLEPGSPADEEIAIALLEARGEPDLTLARNMLARLLGPTGLTVEDLMLDVLWGGQLDAQWPQPKALVLGAELPSGAVAIVGGWSWESGEASGPSVLRILPSETVIRDHLVVMRTSVSMSRHGPESASHLVIVGPGDAVSARVMSGDRVLEEVALTEGAGSLRFPTGTDHVVVVDVDGEILADEPVGTVENIGYPAEDPVG